MTQRHELPTMDDAASADSLQRVRAAARQELRRLGAARPWRIQAAWLAAGIAGLTIGGGIAVAIVNWPAPLVAGRLPALAIFALAQIAGVVAAMAPRRSPLALACWSLLLAGAAIALAGRPAHASTNALLGWICSGSHLVFGLGPIALLWWRSRDVAFTWTRALTAGAALGVSALLWGEIVCERDRAHLLLHHGGALVALGLITVAILRVVPRRGYVP